MILLINFNWLILILLGNNQEYIIFRLRFLLPYYLDGVISLHCFPKFLLIRNKKNLIIMSAKIKNKLKQSVIA